MINNNIIEDDENKLKLIELIKGDTTRLKEMDKKDDPFIPTALVKLWDYVLESYIANAGIDYEQLVAFDYILDIFKESYKSEKFKDTHMVAMSSLSEMDKDAEIKRIKANYDKLIEILDKR